MQRVRQDDLVRITAGKDKGREGRVRRVLRDRDKVVVEGYNLVTRHMRPQTSTINPDGGRIELEAPIHVSNVMLVCPGCDEAVRVGYRFAEDGERHSKTRVCKQCDTEF